MHRQQRHIVAGSFWLSALDYILSMALKFYLSHLL